MTYVITAPCLGERHAKCVEVCPVNCIYPGEHEKKPFMVIDPDVCIDCGACLHVCPVNAIVDRPQKDLFHTKLNEELAKVFKNNPPI